MKNSPASTGPTASPASSDAIAPHERELLSKAGHSLDGPDLAFFETLRPSQRDFVAVRLDAIMGLDAGLTPEQASQMIGVSKSTLYRLKNAWHQERSIRALAGAANRPPRGSGSAANLEQARRIATEIVRDADAETLSIHALALRVKETTSLGISLKAAEVIVREARRRMTSESGEVPEGYGHRLLLDTVAISLSITHHSVRPHLALLTVVMERTTGLMLSAKVSSRRYAAAAQRTALRAAQSFLRSSYFDVPGDEPAELLAVAPPVEADRQDLLVATLIGNLGRNAVVTEGTGRFGRRTIELIGRRLGPLHLIPRATEHGTAEAARVSATGREPVPLSTATEFVRHVVDDHNAPILERLRRAYELGHTTVIATPGRMYRTLDRALTLPHDQPTRR